MSSAADDRQRFEAVFAEVYEPLQRYVRRRIGAAEVDDVIGDTLLVMWRRLHDIPADAVLAWCYGVARGCLANKRRSADRQLKLVGRIVRERAPSQSTDDPMLDALACLPDADRELLRLWAWEQLPPREIAVVLDITPNAASIRLHRATKKLEHELQRRKDNRARTYTGAAGKGGGAMTELDDELRTRLSKLDPVPASEPVDPSTSLRARELLERTVNTTVEVKTDQRPAWRKPAALVTAAAIVVAVGIGVIAASSGNDTPKPKAAAKTTVALKRAAVRPGIQSCIRFDVDTLKGFPVAFAATATTIADGTATLTVDHWYKGGTADIVTVPQPPVDAPLEGGVQFEAGKQYLVTASDGTVTGCGFTAERTPDLERAFAEAFPG